RDGGSASPRRRGHGLESSWPALGAGPARFAGGRVVTRQLANIALRSGWHFRLSQEGRRYHAELTAPVRGQSVTLRYWPSVERVLESVCTNHLKLTAGLPEVAASLRSRVEAELR